MEPDTPARRWDQPRTWRRCAGVGMAAIFLAAFGVQGAPYARVRPGPTPDVTAAVAAAQPATASLDPQFGTGGRVLATTIRATQLSWFATLRCSLTPGCAMLPIDTSTPQAAQRATEQMRTSQEAAAQAARALIGQAPSFPEAQLTADLGEVGGPSAGLMLTLTFIDALTPGDLTGSRTIAGTGTVTPAGLVGRVAGTEHKVVGAHAAGATVFFVPAAAAKQTRAAAPEGITVVPTDTVRDAVDWLCAHGGTSSICRSGGPAPTG